MLHPLPPIKRRRRLQIICIQHIHPLPDQQTPNLKLQTRRPSRRFPIPRLQTPLMRAPDLPANGLEVRGADVPCNWDPDGRPHGNAGVVAVARVEGVGGEVRGAFFALGAGGEVVGRGRGGGFIEFVEGRVEEDVAVGLVGGEEVEGGVSRTHDGYCARDEFCAVPVAEVAFFSEGREVLLHAREQVAAVGFEVDEEDQGLVGVFVEDACACGLTEFCGWIPGEY